eukprot:1105379-Prymnesium_polylepis.2
MSLKSRPLAASFDALLEVCQPALEVPPHERQRPALPRAHAIRQLDDHRPAALCILVEEALSADAALSRQGQRAALGQRRRTVQTLGAREIDALLPPQPHQLAQKGRTHRAAAHSAIAHRDPYLSSQQRRSGLGGCQLRVGISQWEAERLQR